MGSIKRSSDVVEHLGCKETFLEIHDLGYLKLSRRSLRLHMSENRVLYLRSQRGLNGSFIQELTSIPHDRAEKPKIRRWQRSSKRGDLPAIRETVRVINRLNNKLSVRPHLEANTE
jgi:hypothetical protein